MNEKQAIVYVVDDNPSFATYLKELIQSVDLEVEAYKSAEEFLSRAHPSGPCCIVLDVRMPGLSGLDLQERLAAARISLPIVFITGFGDVATSVRAMKGGAVDFLEKPFAGQKLLDSVHKAIEQSRLGLRERALTDAVRGCLKTLTPREAEVLVLVAAGLPNKQIASELGTSEQTIKIHRSRVMQKMHAQSLPDLVRMVERLHLQQTEA